MRQLCLCFDTNIPILCLCSLSSAGIKCWHKVELISSYTIIFSPVKLGDSFPLRFKHFSFSPFSFAVQVCESTCERSSDAKDRAWSSVPCSVDAAGEFLPGYRGCWDSQELHMAHRELLAFQLLARISARFLHQLDDL